MSKKPITTGLARTRTAVGLIDVAKLAGTSVATASGILNGHESRKLLFKAETRKKVEDAANALGYIQSISAQRLRYGKTHLIGVVMRQNFKDRAYAGMVEAIEKTLHRFDYRMLLSLTGTQDPQSEIRRLLSERVDGLLFGATYSTADLNFPLQDLKIPMVVFGGETKCGLDEVVVDFRVAVTIAAKYLAGLGHRNVGFLRSWSISDAVLQEEGIKSDTLWCIEWNYAGSQTELFHPLIRQFVRHWKAHDPRKRPTAMICRDDNIATILLSELYQAGISVPHELSVVGIGNVAGSEFLAPPLTTVDIHAVQRVTLAAECLLARIANPNLPISTKWVSPELVVRSSVAPV